MAMAASALGMVITDGKVELQRCELYDVHLTAILHAHHVIPHSWWEAAGKPVDTPLLQLCPTCHYDTHSAIDGLIAGHDISALPQLCQDKAHAAITGAKAAGLTPAKTL